MIAALLDAATRRVRNADACVMTDETVTVSGGRGGREVSWRDGLLAHLRVEDEGRRGVSVRDDGDVARSVETALASARHGPAGGLFRPVPAPLPGVRTHHPGAAALDPRDLHALASALEGRLAHNGRVVRPWAERSTGRVDVANSRGVLAGYDVTLVGVGTTIAAPARDPRLALALHAVGTGVPVESDIAGLAAEADAMLDPPLLEEPPPGAPHPLWLSARALGVLLTPLRQALLAQGVWSAHGALSGRVGDRIVSERITVVDDPLADGRPGSRPVDDDGVVTRHHTLIDRGILKGALADLEAAARFGIPATGNGRRSGGPRAWIGWSNLVLAPGEASRPDLAAAASGGVLVRALPRVGGDCSQGRVTWVTPWAYKVEHGEVVGRYARYVLRASVYEMLNRVLALGREARWIGAACVPEMVVEVVG